MTGWVAGGRWDGGVILHTEDGGKTWQNQRSGLADPLMALYFTDKLNGWAAGFGGTVINTQDGGNSWNVRYKKMDEQLTSIWFLDKNKGYVTGVDGSILHTSDGGITWNVFKADASLTEICFTDPMNGWVIGGRKKSDGTFNGVILHSNDGGVTWNYQREDIPELLLDIHFFDNNTGWAVGGTSTDLAYKGHNGGSCIIINTCDGGNNWNTIFRTLRVKK